ncbi:MAG: DNA translocase FtsK [Chloroflexi bacterium]|nr:DNA translocase FtsK [Chloroflexota bacterium]
MPKTKERIPQRRRAKRRLPRLQWRRGLGAILLGLSFGGLVWMAPILADVLTRFGQGLIRTLGLGLAWIILALGAVGWRLWQRRRLVSWGHWRQWLGVLIWGLVFFGILAYFRPQLTVGGVLLSQETAGGDLGQAIKGAHDILGFFRLIALALAGWVLLMPRLAKRVTVLIAAGLTQAYRRWRARVAARAERQRLLAVQEPAHREVDRPTFATDNATKPLIAKAAPLSEETEGEPGTVDTPLAGSRWTFPSTELLEMAPELELGPTEIEERAKLIEEALASYGVEANVVQINPGPAVTQFAVEPGWDHRYRRVKERDAEGRAKLDKNGNPILRQEEISRTRVKVERITSLANDLALALAAPSVRIEAPVPGKPVIGIEVPNSTAGLVTLRSVVETIPFQKLKAKSKLALALGKSGAGEAVVGDLAKMPHLLIAGATGSGKSVCINSIITCLMMHATPEEVQFIMVDPKRVELVAFQNVPHLLSPVVVDLEKVVEVLRRVAREMDERYRKFAAAAARNIEAYNRNPKAGETLPYLVVVIDELADLMMVAPYEVERTICRLAQLARATGIHLVVATQRPSVDVVTGLIKANFPTRISFAVTSQVDSRTILDMGGAEKLLGRGDMLYLPTDAAKPKRLQGVFVSDGEIDRVVGFWQKLRWGESYLAQSRDRFAEPLEGEEEIHESGDTLFDAAKTLATEHSHISTSLLQRRLHVGYPRAARLMEQLETEGIVGAPEEGGKSRPVLAGRDDEEPG